MGSFRMWHHHEATSPIQSGVPFSVGQVNLLRVLIWGNCKRYFISSVTAMGPSGAWNPPSLLILPGLLRSDRGGLSVSSSSGERPRQQPSMHKCFSSSCLHHVCHSSIGQNKSWGHLSFRTDGRLWSLIAGDAKVTLQKMWICSREEIVVSFAVCHKIKNIFQSTTNTTHTWHNREKIISGVC